MRSWWKYIAFITSCTAGINSVFKKIVHVTFIAAKNKHPVHIFYMSIKAFHLRCSLLFWLTNRTAVVLLRMLQGSLVLSRSRIKIWPISGGICICAVGYTAYREPCWLCFFIPFTNSYKITRMKMLGHWMEMAKTDASSKGVRNLAAVKPSTVCHNKVRKWRLTPVAQSLCWYRTCIYYILLNVTV